MSTTQGLSSSVAQTPAFLGFTSLVALVLPLACSNGDDADAGESPFETLRGGAAEAGKLIGTAVDPALLQADPAYAEILAREFDYVTPENAMKWEPLEPTDDGYAWEEADAVVETAEANGQAVKGHTLVWHRQYPSWLDGLDEEQLRTALEDHIKTTMARYSGRVRAWDVVNEAVDTNSGSGYTESVFYNTLGPSYIEAAFRWAREADPDALLFYNEVAIERMGSKSDFTYQMLQELVSRGVPVDGIGLQSHVSTHRYPSLDDLRANIRRFADLGLIVNISEVDARARLMPGDEATRFHAQRVAFQQIVGACAVEPECESITFWGFLDAYSWINDEGPEDALLFDREYQPKPGFVGAMDGLAGRLPVAGGNLLDNADFSDGSTRWAASAGELHVGAAEGREGAAACVAERVAATDGVVQEGLLERVGQGGPMAFSAWVRASEAGKVDASLLIEDEEGSRDFNIATRNVSAQTWTRFSGYLGLGFEGAPSAVALKIHGPDAGAELCVAELELRPLDVE